MTISMYAASVPVFIRQLKSASSWLDKSAANAAERKIDQMTLIRDRLAPDMLPMWRQFYIAADHAKNCAGRLSAIDAPKFGDDEPKDFKEIQQRLQGAITYLEGVEKSTIEGSEERSVTITIPGREMTFTGLAYLTSYALPNFMFHSAMAYAILRHNGVPLGKSDFLMGGG